MDGNGRDGALSPQKSYRTILYQEIVAGLAEVRRPPVGLFLSSLSAGLNIGFSLLLMGAVTTLLGRGESHGVWAELVLAGSYSVGFILVIIGRSELFTEHTTLAVMPVLAGRSSLTELARVWSLVFVGNMLGATAFAALVSWVAPALGIIEPWAFAEIAQGLTRQPPLIILASAILAGWLMGELGWLLGAARETISQLAAVFVVTSLIGFAHLHHVVVGAVEVLAGVFATDAVGSDDFLRFVTLTALGNTIGGVFFVAVIKYGHASRSIQAHNDVEERAADRAMESAGGASSPVPEGRRDGSRASAPVASERPAPRTAPGRPGRT